MLLRGLALDFDFLDYGSMIDDKFREGEAHIPVTLVGSTRVRTDFFYAGSLGLVRQQSPSFSIRRRFELVLVISFVAEGGLY